MKLLADENFPQTAVEALRSIGHDVLWIRSDILGMGDEQILSRARAESRVLVTFDKDFGELAYRSGLPSHCGVILFRINQSAPDSVARRAAEVIQSRGD